MSVFWASLLIAALVLGTLVPVRLRVSMMGRGDPEGRWSAAGGLQFGMAAFTGVAATGVTPQLQLRLLGRSIYTKEFREVGPGGLGSRARRWWQSEAKEPRPEGAKMGAREAANIAWELWVRVLRWTRCGEVRAELLYALDDVVSAGKIYGACSVAQAFTPRGVHFCYKCDWMGPERFEGELNGHVKIWLLPALATAAWWGIKQKMGGRRG